ncbi:glycosyltransferase family 4 protein [Dietzia cinnamea]|uniref:Phosphatidylinositol alpha-1,6-mannosyltransferase n=1 Tax=Dietzia cinnamea TaxID=321318 RepID=A0A4R3ZS09_9ACTN|nr:glycosyltransferase family 4 protein [Dietzia cinnamea]MCT2274559.1 glycosyltransferase family 4 protein [Dietzia cinnamea]TCW23008.1 phosphatidylinositol alpha-1,6-mannosyltransferase [Dietzia cinnamea]
MTKTLLITNDYPPRPGGIQSYLETYLSHLDPAEVAVLASTFRGAESAEYDASKPYLVERVPTEMLLPTPDLAARARRLASDFGATTIWFGAAAPLAAMAPVLREGPVERVVASTHGHEVGWSMLPGSRQVLRVIGESTDAITYVSDYTRRRVSAAFGPRARLVRQPGGVDTERFRPDPVRRRAIRDRYGVADRDVIVCLSRLVPRKGQDALIRAMPEIARRVPGAVLVVVGGGPYRRTLEGLARRYGVADRVIFSGRIPADEIVDHHRMADVFAMPCRTRGGGLDVEGLGIVYLEASACGVPVVAGRSGGAPETVRDGRTGLVVDGTSRREIVDAVAGLLEDRPRASSMGLSGRRWVLENWRWEDLARDMQRVLSGE